MFLMETMRVNAPCISLAKKDPVPVIFPWDPSLTYLYIPSVANNQQAMEDYVQMALSKMSSSITALTIKGYTRAKWR